VILSLVLPPLLYADAWNASWLDFRRWLRPILQLAIGLVGFTIVVVGVVAHALMPELPWSACFLLGAILSPTDTVATHAVLERLRIPRRVTAILSGESLINDASALLGVQLALVVVLTGDFEAGSIGLGFLRVAGLGALVGIAVGALAVIINARLSGTQVLFALSLFAPYLAYGLAEGLHASGVLAVVVAGFVASWRIDLIAAETRVGLYASWEDVVFLLNGIMFLYIGLETPVALLDARSALPGLSIIALAVAVAVVLARVAWVFPGAYLPLWLFPSLRAREGGYAPPQAVALASWCGVRGAVSLAAALSLPAVLPDGSDFPGRGAIVGCTLAVILLTLVGQGLPLPLVVRWLGLKEDEATQADLRRAREALLQAGIRRLDGFCSEQSCPIAVYRFRDLMTDQLAALRAEDSLERQRAKQRLAVSREVRRAVHAAQSTELLRLRDAEKINDLTHQALQLELDKEQS
jgi:CPA1 family monovalent cation:H+ antiporter